MAFRRHSLFHIGPRSLSLSHAEIEEDRILICSPARISRKSDCASETGTSLAFFGVCLAHFPRQGLFWSWQAWSHNVSFCVLESFTLICHRPAFSIKSSWQVHCSNAAILPGQLMCWADCSKLQRSVWTVLRNRPRGFFAHQKSSSEVAKVWRSKTKTFKALYRKRCVLTVSLLVKGVSRFMTCNHPRISTPEWSMRSFRSGCRRRPHFGRGCLCCSAALKSSTGDVRLLDNPKTFANMNQCWSVLDKEAVCFLALFVSRNTQTNPNPWPCDGSRRRRSIELCQFRE